MPSTKSGTVETGTILDKIIATTIQTNELKKSIIPVSYLRNRGKTEQPPTVSLRRALSDSNELGVIAEIKRASPSKGRFPVEFEVEEVADQYLSAGADAISVLTDEPYFQGLLDDLMLTAEIAHAWSPSRPVLRKDFIVDPYQVVEAKAWGADATLLIVAALTDEMLRRLMEEAKHVGIEMLVEVHDEAEMERALSIGADLIGINNRDLHTFHVDLGVTERLAAMAPDDVVLVGESGIFTNEDAGRMRAAGVDAVLVGESLILAANRNQAVEQIKIKEPRAARA